MKYENLQEAQNISSFEISMTPFYKVTLSKADDIKSKIQNYIPWLKNKMKQQRKKKAGFCSGQNEITLGKHRIH